MRYQQTVYNHMNQKQLAEYWGISERTLERWRSIGWGPKFVKIGGRVLYRVEDILEYEVEHLADSTKSRSLHKKPAKSPTKPASMPQATTLPAELAEPDWRPITAEIQEGLLIFEIPSAFQYNGGELEYCLINGELRLRPKRMPLEQALCLVSRK